MSEAFEAYHDERRTELIDGQIVAMSPSPAWNHVSIAINIYNIFNAYLHGKKCKAIPDGFDLHLTKKDVFVPDFMVVCDRDKIKPNGVYGGADLIVEVLSPSTTKRDRGYKKRLYAEYGTKEYWLVSPNEKSIEVYLNNGKDLVCHDIYTVYPDWQLEQMTDEERANVVTKFRCSLFEELEISLDDVFFDLL